MNYKLFVYIYNKKIMKYPTFSSDNKFGMINDNQEIILPAIYDNIVFDF